MTTLTASTFGQLGSLPLGHLLLWGGLIVLTLVLIVLVVSKWGKTHPVATCGVLSLLAHVLLACVATIVRLVAAADQVAEGPPIRVRIVDVDAEPTIAPPPTPQPQHDPPPTAADDAELSVIAAEELPPVDDFDEPTPAIAKESPANEPPPATPDPLPEPLPVLDPTTLDPAAAEMVSDVLPPDLPEPVDAFPEPIPSVEEFAFNQNSLDAHTDVAPIEPPSTSEWTDFVPLNVANSPAPTYVAAQPSVPEPYANRQRSDRLGFVEREGGSRETEAAVRAALAWLAAAQSRDGRWDASRFAAGQERNVLGQNRSGAGTQADSGVSALSLLAFLGAGYSQHTGEYRQTVDDGLQFLVRQQAADGNLGGDATLYARMYCHSMATFALAEASAITGDSRLEPAVRRAVNYTIAAQHPASGGWRYRPGQTGDTSQLGWQLMALESAELAGFNIPTQTWTSVERFLRSVTRGPGRGLASYRADGPVSRSMTAEAFYCRQVLASSLGSRIEPNSAAEASQALLAERPGEALFNLYYWYYATLALHHQKDASTEDARAWRSWNEAMKSTLLATQVAHGTETGSWSPDTVWGGYGGRVYSTAMAALCLEVYYRYAPSATQDNAWIATQPENSTLQR